MKTTNLINTLLLLLLPQLFTFAEADVERDKALDLIPANILEVVARNNQGIKLMSAEEVYNETLIMYEIEGEYNGKKVEIQVSPEGDILKMKNEYCNNNVD